MAVVIQIGPDFGLQIPNIAGKHKLTFQLGQGPSSDSKEPYLVPITVPSRSLSDVRYNGGCGPPELRRQP